MTCLAGLRQETALTRQSGGAIGLAVGNTILQNIFANRLPTSLSSQERANLVSRFEMPSSLDSATRDLIRAACESLLDFRLRGDADDILDMEGLRAVFIFFVPAVAICLAMCFFIKVCCVPSSVMRPASFHEVTLLTSRIFPWTVAPKTFFRKLSAPARTRYQVKPFRR